MATLRIRNATNTGWVDASTASGFRIRDTANAGWINKTGNPTGVAVRNATNTGWVTFSGGGVTYSVSPSAGSVNEGSSVTYSVSTTGVANGTVLYWTNAGTTVAADFSDGQNSGSVTINSNAGTITRTLLADTTTEGTETIVLQLRTTSVSGTVVATSSTVSVNDTSTSGGAPTQLSLYYNDLDFYTLAAVSSSVNTAYNDIICTVTASSYFSNGGNHIAFPMDLNGAQGSNNPHCGPIYRNGANLWANGRGFIIFGDGSVQAEQWNSTFSPGLSGALTNLSGTGFSPATNPTFTVRIKGGYRAGSYANTMQIEIFDGTSFYGTKLFTGSVPWGWDWTGSHQAAIAGIGPGFVKPADTGCVESLTPRGSASAVLPFSNFLHRIF